MLYEDKLKDFYSNSTAALLIPDLSEDFIPQGIAYDSSREIIFITGYMSNGKSSPIYAFDKKSGKLRKKILMKTETGEDFVGHAGGLSVYEDHVYIAGSTDACMYSFAIEDILNAEDGSSLQIKHWVSLKNGEDYLRVSFTSVDDECLYAGEFHKGLLFYTNKSHKVEYDGTKQKAYLFGFSLDENGNAVPKRVYSIPDDVQGACFTSEYVFLSKSNVLLPGVILSYSLKELKQAGTKKVLGVEVPLYVLTEDNTTKTTDIPLMPEEVVPVDDRLYLIFESASNRYKIGRSYGLDKVYSAPVSYFV